MHLLTICLLIKLCFYAKVVLLKAFKEAIMALPLLWIGAGIAAVTAGSQVVKELNRSATRVKPVDGAIVCCGIMGVFEHSGIWVEGSIIELRGNGLIRPVSPERFLAERSGSQIYIATDAHFSALQCEQTVNRAVEKLYTYEKYHVLNNNCHRFVHRCMTGNNESITRFGELNSALTRYFDTSVAWYTAAIM